ncbi:GtrA family protein [Rhodopseudomonas sp. P1]|uniref:GtrA family protein n=1 Tax=Rhodopseudomonas sp. P1 TaxID=3434357 RepID=UPI0031FC4A45
MKSIRGESLRFIVAGGANTVLTYLVYLLMLNWVSYPVAFTVSFVTGVLFAFAVYSLFVFRIALDWRRMLPYPLLYGLQYVAGLALLALLIGQFALDERIAPIVNVVVLTPVTFVLNRWYLTRGGRSDGEA